MINLYEHIMEKTGTSPPSSDCFVYPLVPVLRFIAADDLPYLDFDVFDLRVSLREGGFPAEQGFCSHETGRRLSSVLSPLASLCLTGTVVADHTVNSS